MKDKQNKMKNEESITSGEECAVNNDLANSSAPLLKGAVIGDIWRERDRDCANKASRLRSNDSLRKINPPRHCEGAQRPTQSI
jgi:hypothetical protein